MIFTEQDLNIGADAYNIINESVSIDGENINDLRVISLIENSNINGFIVKFTDVESFSEEYGVDYIDTMLAIAEVNGIDPQYLAVAINEADIIMNPDLVYELANVITIPQSVNSIAYQFCEACIDGYAMTGDESYIELLVEDYTTDSGILVKSASTAPPPSKVSLKRPTAKRQLTGSEQLEKNIARHKTRKKFEAGVAKTKAEEEEARRMENWGAEREVDSNSYDNFEEPKKDASDAISSQGAPNTAQKVDDENKDKKNEGIIDRIKRTVGSAAHKSADWIAKKIASLRAMYKGWVNKVRLAKTQGKDKWYQSIGEKVLSAIDWALSKLQNLLKASDKSRENYGMKAWKGKAARVGDHQSYDDWKTANASRIEKYQNFANRHK